MTYSWIKIRIPLIKSLTAGWEKFLKIQRGEQNVSKSLEAGAPPPDPAGGDYSAQTPVMGSDGDLVTTLMGVNYGSPCS